MLVAGVGAAGLTLFAWPIDRLSRSRPAIVAALAIAAGFAAAQIKALAVDTRMLNERLGPTLVTGLVDRVESFPDGQRVTLRRPTIAGLSDEKAPEAVRVRLRGAQPTIRPGDGIGVRAVPTPPPPPTVPGAYGFQRQAYFDGLGVVGYSVGGATVLPLGQEWWHVGVCLWFARLGAVVTERVRAHLDGATAAVTIALLNGDQQAIPQRVMAAIRDSGLAHLLSISGLHIGLVAGIVMFVVRGALALVPPLALRFPIKKWAAVVSVFAAGGYTLLAAAPVPSQRSFQIYGIAANMLAVPVTGFWIMPWAVVAMLLMPFGLEGIALTPLSWGVDVVIRVAEEVAARPGAVVLLTPMPTWSLGLITLGRLWLCIWR